MSIFLGQNQHVFNGLSVNFYIVVKLYLTIQYSPCKVNNQWDNSNIPQLIIDRPLIIEELRL